MFLNYYLIWSMFKETQIWERFGLHCGLLHCMQWHSVRHWIVFIPKIKNLRSVYDLITCYCDHFFADVPWQTNTTSTSFAHLNNLTHPYPQCIEYQKWITQAGIVLFWHFFSEKKHLFVDAIDGDYRGQPWHYIGIISVYINSHGSWRPINLNKKKQKNRFRE